MLATVATIALFVSIAIYIIVAALGAPHITTTRKFFHDAGSPARAIISLTSFNVTLGTGLVYVLGQAATTGALVFLTPLSLALGYVAVGFYYRKVAYVANREQPNIFYLLSPRQPTDGNGLSPFARVFSLSVAITYVLVVAFELSIGSGVVLRSLIKNPSVYAQVGFAVMVFSVVAVYTALGGLRAAVDTDMVQFILVVLFVVTLVFVLPDAGAAKLAIDGRNPRFGGFHAILAAVLSMITAITTQFYSIVNVNMGSSFTPRQQFRIFVLVGALSGLMYGVIAVIGMIAGSPESLEAIIRNFIYSGEQPSFGGIVVTFVLFAGMLAVLLSTLDNATVAVSHIFYENLFKRNPFAPASDEQRRLRGLRLTHISVSIAIAAGMVVIATSFHDSFALLLTFLFVATVFSPIACTTIYLHASNRPSAIDNSTAAWGLAVGVIVVWIGYMWLTYHQRPFEGILVHLSAVAVAVGIAAIDLRRSKNSVAVAR